VTWPVLFDALMAARAAQTRQLCRWAYKARRQHNRHLRSIFS